jgi:polysaccharide export outer membrane protein
MRLVTNHEHEWKLAALLAVVMVCLPVTSDAAERRGGPEIGDLVRVTVYGQPDLTTQARVSNDGTISFPFIGQVVVGGVPTSEAQSNIARDLDQQGIVRNPQVNILVETEGTMSGDFVTVLGHVGQPGRYSLGEGSEVATQTLLDLLAAAGGLTETANPRILVYRGGNEGSESRMEVDMDALMSGGALEDANLKLSNGDVVVVPETDVFYIYGQVSRPGRYALEKNMMVMHAISVGGGITERGNESGIVLTRTQDGDEKRIDAKLNQSLQSGDVIYVKERFF